MIMKKIDIKVVLLHFCSLALILSSCSDFKDYNSEPSCSSATGSLSIWENISGDGSLSDFAAVVKKAGFADELDASHFYTVWAPVNGTFDASELLSQDSTKVLKEFVKNHIADYNYPLPTVEDTTLVYMLNKKNYRFLKSGTFGGVSYDSDLLSAKNGVVYRLDGRVPFLYNVYEYLDNADDCKSVASHLKKYETSYLDEEASVKGPIAEDGTQTWLDSVIVVENDFVKYSLGADVTNEDSSYTMLLPNDQAWDKKYAEIKKKFNYVSSLNWQRLEDDTKKTAQAVDVKVEDWKRTLKVNASYYADSLTRLVLVKDLFFSNKSPYNTMLTNEAAEGDTLYSTVRSKLTNTDSILAATVRKVEMSNGLTRVVNDLPFHPWESYNAEISTIEVARSVDANVTQETILRADLDPAVVTLDDELTQLRYVKAAPSGSIKRPEIDFYIYDVCSGAYNIYVVTLPACLENPETTTRLPYCLRFDLNYADASGAMQNVNWGTIASPILVTEVNKADTIFVGTHEFPACYVGLNAAPNFKISHALKDFMTANRKKYEQTLRIANVIFRPVELDEYEPFIKKDE